MTLVEAPHVRAWITEDADAAFAPVRVVERQESVPVGDVVTTPRRAVVELARDIGETLQRALLGGVTKAASEGWLGLRILVSSEEVLLDGPRVSCASGREMIRGLPAEFTAAVEAAVLTAGGPAQTLVIDRAAYDPVESSPAAFTAAARLLRHVLSTGVVPDGDQLRAIVSP